MATMLVPLLVLVAGLVVFLASSNAKVADVGRWMFIVGLFWTVAALQGHAVRLP